MKKKEKVKVNIRVRRRWNADDNDMVAVDEESPSTLTTAQ